jgi:5-(carboxyamino)imidazole ribonucleotide synthase
VKVGILGAGQLGRMLALAGHPLGIECRCYDVVPDAPAGHVAPVTVGRWEVEALLDRWAEGLDVVSYEFENVPVEVARRLATRVPVHPSPLALETAQDRVNEKRCFLAGNIPTAPFAPAASEEELEQALGVAGTPAVLKTRRMGYDGKGQLVLRDPADRPAAWRALAAPLIAEGFVRFTRELSIIAVRGTMGETRFYPLVQNAHRAGILRLSEAPAPNVAALQAQAEAHAARILDALDYVGVLAVELFQEGGRLLANEMAPRVHNSGHWTIEGAETSQFENHLRAVCGLPLGSTAPRGPSAMLNIIGEPPPSADVLSVAGAHLHLYGKAPRPGRKLGHVTVTAPDDATLRQRVSALLSRVPSLAVPASQ